MGVPRMSAADLKEVRRREAMRAMIGAVLREEAAIDAYDRVSVHAPEAEKEAAYRRMHEAAREAVRAYDRARRLGLVA